MSNDFVGLLIVLLLSLASANVIMATRSEVGFLAWLNQLIIGTILIAVVSYLVVRFSTKKPIKEAKAPKEEPKKDG